jgi:hypothetical protein
MTRCPLSSRQYEAAPLVVARVSSLPPVRRARIWVAARPPALSSLSSGTASGPLVLSSSTVRGPLVLPVTRLSSLSPARGAWISVQLYGPVDSN